MSDFDWRTTLNKFTSAVDKLDYLYGLTHYSLESGADCHVQIAKLLPLVRAEFTSKTTKVLELEGVVVGQISVLHDKT